MQFVAPHSSKLVRCLGSCLQIRYCSSKPNHYDILGLPKTATKQEIRSSFLQLSKQYHPDTRRTSPDGEVKDDDKFHKIREAYDTLSNGQKKHEYDYFLLRMNRTAMPPHDHLHSQFYADGTIYTEPKDHKGPKRKNRFTNGQVVVLCFLFAVTGAFSQVTLVKYFARKRAARQEKVHEDGLLHLEDVRNRSGLGRTGLQLQIAEFKLAERKLAAKERAKSSLVTETLVDNAPMAKD